MGVKNTYPDYLIGINLYSEKQKQKNVSPQTDGQH